MKKNQLIALSVALFFNFPIFASEKESNVESDSAWYQVDLVVFRYLNNNSGEAWPAVTGYRAPENAIRLQAYSAQSENNTRPLFEIAKSDNQLSSHLDILRDAYIALPISERMLNNQVTALEKNRSYQVIAQKAWRMPVNSASGKQPIEIRTAISGQDSLLLLDGTISVSEERFLHVDIDLWLNKLSPESLYSSLSGKTLNYEQKPSDALASSYRGPDNLIRLHDGSPPLRTTDNFQIKQRRRIRNIKEIQYIDSPEIGVLFKLTPYDRPDALVETGIKILEKSS